MRYGLMRLLAATAAAAMASTLAAAAAGAAARPAQPPRAHQANLAHRAATPGAPLWVTRYHGTDGWGYGESVAASPRGDLVFVTGYAPAGGARIALTTVAYRAGTGARVWVARYSGSGENGDYGWSVAVSPDGDTVFAVGQSDSNYTTVAYDATTGAKLWAAQYSDPSNAGGEALHVAVSPGGRTVFVTGTSGMLFYDINTVAYDVATGAQLWAARYSSPDAGDDWPYGMAVSPDGAAVYITGSAVLPTGDVYITLAYDAATGAKLWQKTYKGLNAAYTFAAYSVAVSPDGNTVYVTGESGGISSPDCVTIAYGAATGARLWLARHHNPSNGINRGASVVASPDGSTVFVTGWTWRADSGDDYLTMAYSAATGTRLWLARYNGPANSDDGAVAAAVNRDGTVVYVTGTSWGTGEDYATVAYGAAIGTRLWARRYNGPGNGNDYAQSMAVSPDGTAVYVTGSSVGTGSAEDYATIAYGG